MTTKRMGEEGLRWFVGVVVDNKDPKQLGRIRVRVVNETDDTSIPVSDLPWATPIIPITSASLNGVGRSPTGLLVGSHVFGFYLDGQEKQLPMIWGTYAKLPDGTQNSNDVPALARGTNDISNKLVGPEPESSLSYGAIYPHNHVTKTESGHVIEVDDTEGHERIRIIHKTGTYVEVNRTGQRVSKIVDNDIEVVVKDKTVYVSGNCNITVLGSCNITAEKTVKLKSDNNSIVLEAKGGVQIIGGLMVKGSLGSKLGQSGSFHTLDKVVTFVNGIITDIT
jgi:hypothetical protein